jgi:hypothetical protein
MRILDQESDKSLNRITLYLTLSEASELRDSLISLLAERGKHHEHIPSSDFQKELTVSIYETQSIEAFDERSKRLLMNDT